MKMILEHDYYWWLSLANVVIREEKRTEEEDYIWVLVVVIVFISILAFMTLPPFIAVGIFFVSLISVFLEEKFVIDKGTKSVIIERRTINKKFKLEWKENIRISFSDIREIRITKEVDSEYGNCWKINLINISGEAQEITWDSNFGLAKDLGIKFCRAIGVKGYYIDETNNSTQLIGKKHGIPINDIEPDDETILKDLHNQTLRLEQGWGGHV